MAESWNISKLKGERVIGSKWMNCEGWSCKSVGLRKNGWLIKIILMLFKKIVFLNRFLVVVDCCCRRKCLQIFAVGFVINCVNSFRLIGLHGLKSQVSAPMGTWFIVNNRLFFINIYMYILLKYIFQLYLFIIFKIYFILFICFYILSASLFLSSCFLSQGFKYKHFYLLFLSYNFFWSRLFIQLFNYKIE